ncbi:MAG: class I SAM-dependent methyltransferase [Candidatus Bathyarchaeia archaeon]
MCETSDYNEIKEEKRSWDEKAKTVKDEIELRGALKNSAAQLGRSIAQICRFFGGGGSKNLFLDVGCGNALFTFPMADIFEFVVGIDISKDMIKRCQEKRANLDFIMGSATDLPFKDGVFDAIQSLSLLQHLRTKLNVEKTLREVSRVASHKSKIFLTFWDTPNSPTKYVRQILKSEGYRVQQSWISKFQFTGLQLTKYVKLKCFRK